MPTPLLTTKLYIPPPHLNLVPRPRLIERVGWTILTHGEMATLLGWLGALPDEPGHDSVFYA